MKKVIYFFLALLITFPFITPVYADKLDASDVNAFNNGPGFAQPMVWYEKARIIQIKKEYTKDVNGFPNNFQTLQLKILDGKEQGKTITFEHNTNVNPALKEKLQPGATVIVQAQHGPDNTTQYVITDVYRLPVLIVFFVVFAILAVGLTGVKGIGALVGLCVSLAVILGYIVPQILNHADPLEISIIGALIILFLTTYLAHGISKQTTLAIAATFLSLLFTYFLAEVFVRLAHLSGLGTEDTYLLQLTPNQSINPKGLLLGGIIISTLGALNDITITQVSTVFSLHGENKKLAFAKLYNKSFAIGKQHILSLVNTLVLAYAGASLPVFVFMILNPLQLPVWAVLNSEALSEEIVRAIAGSIGLILAVPIATILASYFAIHGFELKGKLVEHK